MFSGRNIFYSGQNLDVLCRSVDVLCRSVDVLCRSDDSAVSGVCESQMAPESLVALSTGSRFEYQIADVTADVTGTSENNKSTDNNKR